MTKSKLGTGLVTEAAKKPIELKNTDYAINKFQSDFSKGQKTIRTKISNSGLKGLKISQNITIKIKLNFLNKARIGDHIWWISNNSRFMKDFPNFRIKYSIENVIEELITNI